MTLLLSVLVLLVGGLAWTARYWREQADRRQRYATEAMAGWRDANRRNEALTDQVAFLRGVVGHLAQTDAEIMRLLTGRSRDDEAPQAERLH